MAHEFLQPIVRIALKSGQIALRDFRLQQSPQTRIRWKSDNTPVTETDIQIDAFIRRQLHMLAPSIPLLSEESTNSEYSIRRHWQTLWLIDPLDGTKHFIAGNPDYSINIALVHQSSPVLSVVYAPSRGLCYYALRGEGSFLLRAKTPNTTTDKRLHCAPVQQQLRILISHGKTGDKMHSYMRRQRDYTLIKLGSSLKQCWIAEGKADVYPRFGRTSEWDTAAAQLVLEEAHGKITNSNGQPLRYNKENLQNPEFIASAAWYKAQQPWY